MPKKRVAQVVVTSPGDAMINRDIHRWRQGEEADMPHEIKVGGQGYAIVLEAVMEMHSRLALAIYLGCGVGGPAGDTESWARVAYVTAHGVHANSTWMPARVGLFLDGPDPGYAGHPFREFAHAVELAAAVAEANRDEEAELEGVDAEAFMIEQERQIRPVSPHEVNPLSRISADVDAIIADAAAGDDGLPGYP